MEELIRVEHATKTFRSKNWRGTVSEVRAVEDVSLTIHRGETLGLVGESGSGKTTLGRSILNLETLTSGEIFFEGKELTALTAEDRKAAYQQMQIIFQDPYSSLNPRMTALELVMEPLYHETKDAARAKAKEILAIVGITGDDVHKLPRSFSGGQRQRIGSLPAMAGGVGAGAVPLSTIYANVLGTDASSIISRLIPATAMTNVLAIIGAALVARAGQSMPKFNGNGKLMEKGDLGDGKPRNVKPSIPQLGVGLMVSLTFFILGQIGNYFVPKVHAYAFMIIIVVICKIANLLPEYYEDAAIMFNNLIVKNLTAAVLAGIGIALLNLNVLASALTWQFVVLCLTSVIAISVVSGFVGRLFGLYPIESTITAGLCNNSMGGTGNVAVLSAANRMELIAFAQMGNRLGGAIVLIISGFLMQLLS